MAGAFVDNAKEIEGTATVGWSGRITLDELEQRAEAGDERARQILAELRRSGFLSTLDHAKRWLVESWPWLSQAIHDAARVYQDVAPILESSAFQAELVQASKNAAETWAMFEPMWNPETFQGNAYRIRNPDFPLEEREAAAQRLAQKWFTRGAVFHPARWSQLRPHFSNYIAQMPEEKQSFPAAWNQLAGSAIFIAGNDPELLEQYPRELYSWLRKRIRRVIEQDLLAGKTLDATQEEPWPETEEVLHLEAEYQADIESWMIRQEELQKISEGLTIADIDLLLAERGELKSMAEKRGKSYQALRQERHRLLKRIQEKVSQNS